MKCSTSSCDGGCISGSFHSSSSKNSRKSRISRISRKSSNCVLSFECSDGSVASMRYWPYFRIQQNPCQSGVMSTQSLAFWSKFRFLNMKKLCLWIQKLRVRRIFRSLLYSYRNTCKCFFYKTEWFRHNMPNKWSMIMDDEVFGPLV